MLIKRKIRQVKKLEIDKSVPWGFFDGAFKGHPRNSGAGGKSFNFYTAIVV